MSTQTDFSLHNSPLYSTKPHRNSASAWLLEYAPSRYIAMASTVCQEIVEAPQILAVPAIPDYGLGLIQWRNRWLPLVDLHSLLLGAEKKTFDKDAHCLVVAYYTAEQHIAYVALSLPYFPYLITVNNSALCALPTDHDIWPSISLSCFRYQDRRVPIVDSSRLFNRHAILLDEGHKKSL